MSSLNREDAAMFFRIYIPLLGYTNKIYQIHPELPEKIPPNVPLNYLAAMRDKLWGDASIIERYLDEHGSRHYARECDILRSWQHQYRHGYFIFLRQLRDYAVFLEDNESSLVFGVSGITDSIANTLGEYRPPLAFNTVLLPFEDKIIWDGLVASPVIIGPGIHREAEESYRSFKEKHGIILRLDAETLRQANATVVVHDKLVRDRIPEIIAAEGRTPVTKILSKQAYLKRLDSKLQEEVAEYLGGASRDEAIEELGDVLEVIHAILAARGISLSEVEEARQKKLLSNGGFTKRILLERVIDLPPQTAKK